MSTEGGEGTPPSVLGAAERSALERLLAMSNELVVLGREQPECAPMVLLGDSIAMEACALAGIGSVVGANDRVIVVLQLVARTTRLWDCHGSAPSEKASVVYCDGVGRTATLANALVLLARTLLERAEEGRDPPVTTPESVLAASLEEAMTAYEENLESVSEAVHGAWDDVTEDLPVEEEPEPSFHGSGGVD